jgi:hypothetical protein
MALSLKKGVPFASVGGKTIYINDNDNDNDDSILGTYVQLKKGALQLVPASESTRLCIFGPAGAGKSTFAANYIKEYNKKYKKNKIYVVSPSGIDDPAYKDLKNVQFLKIDDSLLTDPIDVTEFKDCLILFDDSEMLSNKKDINKAVELFRNQCLENGRKLNVSVIVINHVAQNGAQTKKVLNECDNVIVFPKSNFSAVSRLCKAYYGFGPQELEYLRTVPSRWCAIKRTYPQAILSEKALKLL